MVQEENPIVSEVTFGENSAGAATVQGSFIGQDQARASFANNRGTYSSREQTLANGKRRIRNVALALRIPDYISDAAFSWFHLALTNNFVQGRRSQNVVAACLYIACRKEKTHHMLIDFSARLQISVYSVGATFLKMVKALHITSLPLADPSLFIQHFAEKMDFGSLKLKVIKDAVKLAHRMSSDWIHEGRRPAGIAGACLLLAARMNNFRRSHTEIVAVAHVGEETIQRRLNEFKSTNAGKVTVKEFRERNDIEPSLPPSYNKNRLQEMKAERQLENFDTDETGDKAMKKDPILRMFLSDCNLSENEIAQELRRVNKRKESLLKKKVNRGEEENDEENEDDEEENDQDENDQLNESSRLVELNRPKNLFLLPTSAEVLKKVSSDAENFEDVDDDDLDLFLLDEEESKLKERIWTGLNQDYLIKEENKRLKQKADMLAGHNQVKRRKKQPKKPEFSEFADGTDVSKLGLADVVDSIGENPTAAETTKSMLGKKSFSRKINYKAVDHMFGG